MRKTDKLVNCADSQALEVFVGACLVVTAWRQQCWSLAIVGGLMALAALSEVLRARQWACAAGFCVALFRFPDPYQILVGLACSWAWYRTTLDHKVSP